MIHIDYSCPVFPNPRLYHPLGGLIAAGGNLKKETVLDAYQLGIFPWYNPGEEILWWCPDPRFVLFPKEIKVSKSMRKVLRDEIFTFTENVRFEEVMRNCQTIERKDQEGTWINEELIDVFKALNEDGIAKSIEVWHHDELVGGFYGLEINSIFCGESMFSKMSNASKAGFINFVQRDEKKYTLIDCQVHSEHLESLGAKMIPKIDYLDDLDEKKNTK